MAECEEAVNVRQELAIWRAIAAEAWLSLPQGVRVAIAVLPPVMIVLALLTGCGGTLPVVPGRTAIPVECREPIPQRPAMPTDNLTPESSLDASVQAMEAALALHEGYEDQLVAALTACTRPIGRSAP
jgi:hypothetical protein